MKNKKFILLFIFFLFPALVFPGEKKEFYLDEIINLGLKNNPLILANEQEVEAKKVAYQASKLLFNPEFEYHRGEGKSYDSQAKVSTEGFAITQSIENPLKRKYRIQTFEKDWQAAESFLDFSKLEVIYRIKSLFFKVLLLKNYEELALKNIDSLEEIYQLILKRVKMGEVKELEAIKLYVETLKAQNELNKVRTEFKLAKENLNKFLGNTLPPSFVLQGKLSFKSLPLDEKVLINKALLSHPFIKKKEKELEKAQSNLSYVNWQRLPDPKLSGFSHKELDGKNKGIGISMEIPLWNFKSKAIAEAKSLVLKERETLKASKLELTAEVKTSFNQLKLSEQTIKLFLSGLLREAEESLKIAEVSYKQGEISLIDYLDSQRTYYGIIKDYQDSLYAWNADKAALEKAVGEELK